MTTKAQTITFTRRYVHDHGSGAWTAFGRGSTHTVASEIARAAIKADSAVKGSKLPEPIDEDKERLRASRLRAEKLRKRIAKIVPRQRPRKLLRAPLSETMIKKGGE